MENAKGFTMIELLVILAIIGILAVTVGPQMLFANKSLQNATNQVSGIFKLTRTRAMVTTSIRRVKPTSATQISVQTAQARVCAASTQLTTAATSTDTVLRVASVNDFGIGDQVTVGSSSTNNSIIATDPSANTITLGQSLGSNQSINSDVNLSINWINDPAFSDEDLTLPQGIQMTSTNWMLCFDSRGIAKKYNSSVVANGDLTVTIKNTGNKQNDIKVLQGGAVNASFSSP